MEKSISSILSVYGLSIDSTVEEIPNGLINYTYLVHDLHINTQYILQRINRSVFPKIDALMDNMCLISDHLNISGNYENPKLIKTIDGGSYFLDNGNNTWRVFEYIENSRTFDSTTDPSIASEAGRIIGQFHAELDGFDADKLAITIPYFHNLDWRLDQLEAALEVSQKSKEVDSENILKQIQALKKEFTPLLKTGLPTRATHNDTKLNNILFNKENKAICLIDLDTLMPGYIYTDYGDALRTLACSVDENESETTQVHFQINLFKNFTTAFLRGMDSVLSKEEKSSLPLSIPFMPFIMAVRFFTDYLNGNTYYKVNYPDQNLDRAKNQLALVESIFSQFGEIESCFEM